mmetsp:Transcript_16703/g.52019  ORF Transcript_16703/g.52019 Transcript_16703/m.52019 type:complete len:221 (+) Transcript_16703:180-842(+)
MTLEGGGYGSTAPRRRRGPTTTPSEPQSSTRSYGVVALCLVVCAAGAAATLAGPGAAAKLTMNDNVDCLEHPKTEVCVDADDGALDFGGVRCAGYSKHGNDEWCGKYDDGDFDAASMCCACGGGTLPTPKCNCDLGYHPENGKCEKNQCDLGYHPENGKCEENQCECDHGSAPMGRDCHSKEPESFCCEQDGKKKCMSCACNGCDVSCHMDDNMVCTCDD